MAATYAGRAIAFAQQEASQMDACDGQDGTAPDQTQTAASTQHAPRRRRHGPEVGLLLRARRRPKQKRSIRGWMGDDAATVTSRFGLR